jgi:hypothetical protein
VSVAEEYYKTKDSTIPAAVQRELDDYFTKLAEDPLYRSAVSSAGIRLADVEACGRKGITLRSPTAGIVGAETGILVGFGSVVLHDLWKQVLLPYLKWRLGPSALRASGPVSRKRVGRQAKGRESRR